MSDPTVTAAPQTATGAAASGSTGQSTGNDLAQVIATAVAAAVSDSLNEVKNLLNDIKNASTNLDTNMEVSTVGNDDAFISLREERIAHGRIRVYAEQALSNCVELAKRCGHAGIDHYGALPPIAPRSSTGPGTTAS